MNKIIQIKHVGVPTKDLEFLVEWLKKREVECGNQDREAGLREARTAIQTLLQVQRIKELQK